MALNAFEILLFGVARLASKTSNIEKKTSNKNRSNCMSPVLSDLARNRLYFLSFQSFGMQQQSGDGKSLQIVQNTWWGQISKPFNVGWQSIDSRGDRAETIIECDSSIQLAHISDFINEQMTFIYKLFLNPKVIIRGKWTHKWIAWKRRWENGRMTRVIPSLSRINNDDTNDDNDNEVNDVFFVQKPRSPCRMQKENSKFKL